MKVFIIDISGKVTNYDLALLRAINSIIADNRVKLIAPDISKKVVGVIHLFSFIPLKFKYSENLLKRIAKAFEGLLNYFVLLLLCIRKRPELLHFQWFPFMEFCSIDIFFVRLIKIVLRKQSIFLTVHNVYPHNINLDRKIKYRERFIKMSKYVDKYIVHTRSSREELLNDYSLSPDKVIIIPHGIFSPDYKPKYVRHPKQEDYHIIMYGNNLPYKGSDILLDAVQLLPIEIKKHIKVTIVGATSEDYLDILRDKSVGLNVIFNPNFVSDCLLYEMIDEADYIALPYKKISQSGVLLLALYFKKPLLVSNLPSFVETLVGFTSDMFFVSEDPKSLKDLILRHIEGQIDVNRQMAAILELNKLYSWNNSAKKTILAYENQ